MKFDLKNNTFNFIDAYKAFRKEFRGFNEDYFIKNPTTEELKHFKKK